MFWIYAVVTLTLGGLVTLYPLLRGKPKRVMTGIALLLVSVVVGLWLYTGVGAPETLRIAQVPDSETVVATQKPASMDMSSMIARLQARLEENPHDPDGWVLLARSFRSVQRPDLANQALETALEISPDNPSVMAELADGRISASPPGQLDNRVMPMLEKALEIEPEHQKALWLMGNAEAVAGNDRAAIAYWESLLAKLEPDRTIAKTVEKQIFDAKTRLGLEVPESPAVPPVNAPPPGISVSVSVHPSLSGTLPTTSVLYVIARPAGTSAGPPLGVRRIDNPSLPLELTLTDRDSMMQNRKISSEALITIQARISQTGSPQASPGDWQSAQVTVSRDDQNSVALVLDHRVE